RIFTTEPIWMRGSLARNASSELRSRIATAWLPETDTTWAMRTGCSAGTPRRSRIGGFSMAWNTARSFGGTLGGFPPALGDKEFFVRGICGALHLLGCRQGEHRGGAGARLAFQSEIAAMLQRQPARDRQAQTGAFLGAGKMRLHLTERSHRDLQLLGIHAA